MQFIIGNGNYVTMRSNILFSSTNEQLSARRLLPIVDEDRRESIAYNDLKRNLEEFVRCDPNYGFRFQSLLLVGPPMCGKSSLLLRLCSKNPKVSVFVLTTEEFVATDVSLFFSMARASLASIIIIDDLDNILSREGSAYNLKSQLVRQLRRLYSDSKYVRGNMMVIGESRYPWTLHQGIVEKYFPYRLCMQQPTKQAMLAQDKRMFEFPSEWIDEYYLRQLQHYRYEHIKPISFRIHPRQSKLSWLLNWFSRLRDW